MDHQRANVRTNLTDRTQIALTHPYSDGPTPEKQCEQILAIYPILKGQKPVSRHSIPPRGSVSGHSSRQPPAEQPAADQGGDLIDFGQNDPHPPASNQPEVKPESKPDPNLDAKPGSEQENRPVLDAYHKSTADIQSMLSHTGSPAPGGPLIDFHQDIKTTLPAGLKRADTTESSDEFVDAHE